MATKNERSMIIELAKSLNQINYSVRLLAIEVANDERKKDLAESVEAVGSSLNEVIRLMDVEWFQK